MTEDAVRPRLGRGLAVLIGDDDEPAPERGPAQRKIPVEFLRPNPRNPRKHFRPDEIEALAGSIRQRGIVQLILVRPLPDQPSVYEIVAGERRWRAAQVAHVHEVPRSSLRSTTGPRSNMPSSRTCSVRASIPLRKPPATGA